MRDSLPARQNAPRLEQSAASRVTVDLRGNGAGELETACVDFLVRSHERRLSTSPGGLQGSFAVGGSRLPCVETGRGIAYTSFRG